MPFRRNVGDPITETQPHDGDRAVDAGAHGDAGVHHVAGYASRCEGMSFSEPDPTGVAFIAFGSAAWGFAGGCAGA